MNAPHGWVDDVNGCPFMWIEKGIVILNGNRASTYVGICREPGDESIGIPGVCELVQRRTWGLALSVLLPCVTEHLPKKYENSSELNFSRKRWNGARRLT